MLRPIASCVDWEVRMRFARVLDLLCFLAVVCVLYTKPLWPQTKSLSAREIFYSAPSEQPAVKKPEAPKSQKKAPLETAKTKPSVPSSTPAVGAPVSRPASEVPLVQAAYTPLGLKYSILRREGADWTEVSPDSVFHSGDRIRLRVEVNAAGYLYVISRGSSGTWKPLFPSAEVAQGDNRADMGKSYDIPSGYVFTFDEQAGQEKLFIVFSRQPEPNLEGLIYSLSSGQKPAEPARPSGGKVLLAQNMVNINDSVVQKLRNVYARDLIIEKVDESSPVAPKEKAVYVVNPARSGDSRVVADIALDHK